MRRLAIIVAAAAAMSLPAVARPAPRGAAERHRAVIRTWFRPCDELLHRPRSVTLACGDGNFGLERMRWSTWNGPVARGSGYAYGNDCTPYCAAGHFHRSRVSVTLDRRTRCPDRRLYYSRIVFRGRRPVPSARHELDPERFPCHRSG